MTKYPKSSYSYVFIFGEACAYSHDADEYHEIRIFLFIYFK